MRRIIAGCCLIFMVILAGCTKGQENKEPQLVLRYADNQPENYPTTKAAHYFASLVKERTEGAIEVSVFSNGELGSENSVLEQIQFGGVDFSRFSLGTLSNVDSKIGVLQMPYLYRDSDHMWRVLDGEIGNMFLSGFMTFNGIGLCWFDAGARSFYTRKPVKRLEDLQGMTIRVMENEQIASIMRKIGIIPVQLPYSDVYSSLRMMTVDGAENNMPSYVIMGHTDVAPYFFADEHLRLPEVLVMSVAAQQKIQKVDPAFVDVVKACAKETGLYQRKQWKQAEAEALSAMQEAGCIITWPDETELAKFKKAMQSATTWYTDEDLALIRRIQSE
jgi:tripartite ATP-independent transporter DctP family solute receptor